LRCQLDALRSDSSSKASGSTWLTQIDLFCATLASTLDNEGPRRTAAPRAFSLAFSITQRDTICRSRPPTLCIGTGL